MKMHYPDFNTYINEVELPRLMKQLMANLNSDFRNYLVLYFTNQMSESNVRLYFRNIDLAEKNSMIILQIFATGKLNINNGINFEITRDIYNWLQNFFNLYPETTY